MSERVVHKILLAAKEGDTELLMPIGARILYVAAQRGGVAVWFEHDYRNTVPWTFYVVMTGSNVPSFATYVGTALFYDGDFVLHVYVTGAATPQEVRDGEQA